MSKSLGNIRGQNPNDLLQDMSGRHIEVAVFCLEFGQSFEQRKNQNHEYEVDAGCKHDFFTLFLPSYFEFQRSEVTFQEKPSAERRSI